MRKSGSKLMVSGFLVVIASTLMVTVSYAWFTMAGAPALAGVQVNIGGSNTIKIAPDVIDYFKEEATETGIPYQTLINLYLVDCVKEKKRINMDMTKVINSKYY